MAAGIFWAALSVRKQHPHRVYSTEAVFFIGVMALAFPCTSSHSGRPRLGSLCARSS
jgi:hypothetical protein